MRWLARHRRAHQGVQLAAAFGRRRVQARHAVAGRGDGRGEVHVDAGDVGEEVRGVGGARGDRVDDGLVRGGAALGADVARERGAGLSSMPAARCQRVPAPGNRPPLTSRFDGPARSFSSTAPRAALRRGERAHHPRGAGADHDHVGIEHAR